MIKTCTEWSCVDVHSDAQMPRSPDAQMPRSPDAQTPRCPEAQMPRYPDAQTYINPGPPCTRFEVETLKLSTRYTTRKLFYSNKIFTINMRFPEKLVQFPLKSINVVHISSNRIPLCLLASFNRKLFSSI